MAFGKSFRLVITPRTHKKISAAPMNILITNGQEDQAYLIAVALRKKANRIVMAFPEKTSESLVAPGRFSRFVSARYSIPSPAKDWAKGNLDDRNSEVEEAYIQAIEEICRSENINVIFPSFDPDIFVLSKNKDRLAIQGILCITGSLGALEQVLDKGKTLEAARRSGFPVPHSRVVHTKQELDSALSAIQGPWIIKSRMAAHNQNLELVQDRAEAYSQFEVINQRQPGPLVQERVPGHGRQNFYMVVGKRGEILSSFVPETIRTRPRGITNANSACVTRSIVPLAQELSKLVAETGYEGFMTVQTVLDQRDGVPRLMEINPRIGNRLWQRLAVGINEPILMVEDARGEELTPLPSVPDGVHVVDPIYDIRHLADLLIRFIPHRFLRLAGRTPRTDQIANQSFFEAARSMAQSYFGPQKTVYSFYVTGLLVDPFPCVIRNLKTLVGMLRIGRHFRT